MAFKMRENHIGIIIREVCADKVTGQVCSTGDRDLDGTIFVKNLEICNFSITMIFGNLIVLGSCCTKAAVGGVAFYNGSRSDSEPAVVSVPDADNCWLVVHLLTI